MKHRILIALSLIILPLFVTSAWAEIKDGLWEITTRIEMKGMPGQIPPTTVRQCLTKKDPVPQAQDKQNNCKMIDQKVSGDTVTYSMECKGKDSVVFTSGTMSYKGNSFTGTSAMKIKSKGQPEMQMNSKIDGKYIGRCTK